METVEKGFNIHALRYHRTLAKMNQSELAAKCGKTRHIISDYERGIRVPDVVSAKTIAKALGCSFEDLLENKTQNDIDELNYKQSHHDLFNKFAMRFYRYSADITQKELSQGIGVNVKTIRSYEKGTQIPSLSRIKAIAKILGCSPENLCEDRSMEVEEIEQKSSRCNLFNGETMKFYRCSAKLSQKMLSQKARIDVKVIRSYEKGERIPTLSQADKIANALSCSVESLSKKISDKDIVLYENKSRTKIDKKQPYNCLFNGNAMRYYRYAAGLTLKGLAQGVKTSITPIYQYEKGIQVPDLSQIKAIAKVFDCSLENLSETKTEKDIEEIKKSLHSYKRGQKMVKKVEKEHLQDTKTTLRFSGNALKYYRLKSKMSQKELANVLNCSTSTIYCYEKGKTIPKKQSIIQIAGILGCSIENLMETVMDEYASFNGNALRYYRVSMGLSQTELSCKTGIHASAISFFETGRQTPNSVQVQNLAKVLGISVLDFSKDLKTMVRIYPKPNISGHKIRTARINAKITQGEFAHALNTTQSYVSRLESRNWVLSTGRINQLSAILKCSTDDLLLLE